MEPAVLPRPARPTRPIRVVVVDDNAGFRESLLSLLEAGHLQVVGEAGSGTEALDLIAAVEPDVVLMDVRMPTMDGIEATRLLKSEHPSVGVIALSSHEDQEIVRGMLVAGASGYVLKDSDGDEILRAVARAAEGGAVLSAAVTPRVIEDLTEALDRERRRTRDLEAAQEALVERSVRRHDLVARLSHELRTPVTVILGVAHTLATLHTTPEQEAELLSRLVTRAQDLAALVERFEITVDSGMTEWVDLGRVAGDVAVDDRVRVVVDPGVQQVRLNRGVARRSSRSSSTTRCGSPRRPSRSRSASPRHPRGRSCGSSTEGWGSIRTTTSASSVRSSSSKTLNVRIHQGAGMGLALARTAARAMDGDVVVETSSPSGSTFLWTIAPSS